MADLLAKDYGKYISGFFVICLGMKLEEWLSLENFNQEEFATSVHEYIHFLQNIIVALAELSLMHYHSGRMFVEFLIYIKKYKIDFKNMNKVVCCFKERIPHLFENYERAYKETEETVNFLYPVDTLFGTVNRWLKMEILFIIW